MNAKTLSSQNNFCVVQLSERKFPGSVIPGDSLSILVQSCSNALQALKEEQILEAQEEIAYIHELLSERLSAYKAVLKENQIPLPFNENT